VSDLNKIQTAIPY